MEYLFTSGKIKGEAMLRYNQSGQLTAFELREDWSAGQIEFMLNNLPKNHRDLHEFMAARGQDAQLIPVKKDISFNAFWEAYNNKVSNKKRSEQLWNKISDSEKLLILQHIPRYDRYLKMKHNMEKCYAETYLNQRRWEIPY